MHIQVEVSVAPWFRAGSLFVRLGLRDWFAEWDWRETRRVA